MDERILVEVYVPAAGKYLEILLPVQAQLRSLHMTAYAGAVSIVEFLKILLVG